MHVVDNKLVGTIVSDVYTENGSVIIVLTDNDTTPVREMQTYSYIQTKELAEIGIAVNPKGVVTIPVYTLAGFNGELDSSLYAITVKYNGELYQIGLADFIELDVGAAVDYAPYVESTYPGQTIGAVIPPFSDENAGQIVSVNEETGKLEWRDETEELPTIAEGDAGKVLTVNADGTGTEWGDIPEELPTIESGDAGKVLKVNSGETGTEWGNIPEELPTIESGDAGKVLKVNSGETGTEWGDIPEELPTIESGDAGKVLKVNNAETGTEWGDVPNELPTIASGDAGKVLKVNADETGTEWGTASGGAIYSHKITFDIEHNLYSVTKTLNLSINIVNSSSTPFTMATLETELRRLGYNNATYLYPVTGIGGVLVNNTTYDYVQPVGVADYNMGGWSLGVALDVMRYDSSTNAMEYRSTFKFTSWNNFVDTVTQI